MDISQWMGMGAGSLGTSHDDRPQQSCQGRKFIFQPLCLLSRPHPGPFLFLVTLSPLMCHLVPVIPPQSWETSNGGRSDILTHQRGYIFGQGLWQPQVPFPKPTQTTDSPRVAFY